MDTLDALGAAGELISWIGFGIGLPALFIGLIGRASDGRWIPIEIVLVEEHDRTLARWYAEGHFWERPLKPAEASHWRGRESVDAFISERHPNRMRAEPRRPVLHAIYVIGITLSLVGVVSTLLSFVPLLVP